jgi:hypothetical protein
MSELLALKREALGVTTGRCLTTGSSLLLAETSTVGSLIVPVPLDGSPELQAPPPRLVPLSFRVFKQEFFFSLSSKGDPKSHHPQCPIYMGGRHKCTGVLPGVLMGLLLALASFHPPVPLICQHDTSHLGIGGTLPRCHPFRCYPSCDKDARVTFWRDSVH